MTRPLRSAPTAPSKDFNTTTGRSAGAPRIGTRSLVASDHWGYSLSPPQTDGGLYRSTSSHVPCESSRSGSRRLHAGHHPASQRASAGLLPEHSCFALVSMSPYPVTTRLQRTHVESAHRLPDPYLTHLVRLFRVAHHDGLQPTQHAVVWSLPPQSGSEGPTPSSLAQHRVKEQRLHGQLLSAFVAHQEICIRVGCQSRGPSSRWTSGQIMAHSS